MNNITIKFEEDYSLHLSITDKILHALPNWFGMEDSIIEYCEKSKKMPMIVIYDGEEPIGFCILKIHYNINCDLYVLGILPKYHRQGLGKKLFDYIENHCVNNGIKYMSVLTLSSKSSDESYGRTRNFYKKCGFIEYFDINGMWDDDNPCLLMIKVL